MRATPLLAALAVLAMAVPVDADHCATYSSSNPELTLDGSAAGGPTYYFEDWLCSIFECSFFAPWIYQESNGIPGLQRYDEVVDDTCHGMIQGDTVIF